MRLVVAVLLVAAAAGLVVSKPSETPLWPGSRYTVEQRDRAVFRGLDFISAFSRDPKQFHEWGFDLLSAFYNIAVTSADPELRRRAWNMGHERAQQFRRDYPELTPGLSADELMPLICGNDAARRLGVPDAHLTGQLRAAAARYTAIDFLGFDPSKEPPRSYDMFQDALIDTYSGDLAGITMGAHYREVLRWLPVMRPWPARAEPHYYSGIYTITHLIYTYNDYSQNRVSPDCFPQELAQLRGNLRHAASEGDSETMGEYLDTLRAFGLTFAEPEIRAGFEYLLSAQNPDGSWGDMKDKDAYGRYHPTWTAVDGLRDYRWTRVLPCPGTR